MGNLVSTGLFLGEILPSLARREAVACGLVRFAKITIFLVIFILKENQSIILSTSSSVVMPFNTFNKASWYIVIIPFFLASSKTSA